MTRPDVIALLECLGKTADDVAESLRGAGLSGQMRKACDCALARYLAAEGVPEPEMHCGYMLAMIDGEWTRFDVLKTNPAVEEFRHRFDAGKYPDLVG